MTVISPYALLRLLPLLEMFAMWCVRTMCTAVMQQALACLVTITVCKLQGVFQGNKGTCVTSIRVPLWLETVLVYLAVSSML